MTHLTVGELASRLSAARKAADEMVEAYNALCDLYRFRTGMEDRDIQAKVRQQVAHNRSASGLCEQSPHTSVSH